jgi:hypothetical protein
LFKGQYDVYSGRFRVNACARDRQQQCEELQRFMLRDENSRRARNTDTTTLSCMSNLRATRTLDAHGSPDCSTIDAHKRRPSAR